MRKTLGRIKRLFKLAISLKADVFRTPAAHPHLRHLPDTFLGALIETLENKSLNKRLNGGRRPELILINGIPKSASKLISSIIEKSLNLPRRYGRYMLLDKSYSNYDLSLELLKDFPGEGVLRTHTAPTPKNLMVLKTLGIKQVLLFRHPLDLMPALYCSFKEKAPTNEPWAFDDLYPVDNAVLDSNSTTEERLNRLMNSGYLLAVLQWMGMWAKFADERQSLIVRYEDFILSPEKKTREILRFLGKAQPTSGIPTAAELKPKEMTSEKYERGYTGQIAVWKKYFSAENKAVYDRIVHAYLTNGGLSEPLTKFYPDLSSTDEFES